MTVEELMESRREFYHHLDVFKTQVKEYCIERSLSTKLVFGEGRIDAFLSMVRLIVNSARYAVSNPIEKVAEKLGDVEHVPVKDCQLAIERAEKAVLTGGWVPVSEDK